MKNLFKLPVILLLSLLFFTGRINILANRLDLWYEYASLISSLIREGFSPSTIEETTDISSIDQNRLIVGAQVSDSLVHSKADLNLAQAPLRDSPP